MQWLKSITICLFSASQSCRVAQVRLTGVVATNQYFFTCTFILSIKYLCFSVFCELTMLFYTCTLTLSSTPCTFPTYITYPPQILTLLSYLQNIYVLHLCRTYKKTLINNKFAQLFLNGLPFLKKHQHTTMLSISRSHHEFSKLYCSISILYTVNKPFIFSISHNPSIPPLQRQMTELISIPLRNLTHLYYMHTHINHSRPRNIWKKLHQILETVPVFACENQNLGPLKPLPKPIPAIQTHPVI